MTTSITRARMALVALATLATTLVAAGSGAPSANAGASTATTTVAAAGSGTLSTGCRHNARGLPLCKQAYVGAAHGSNSDPAGLEADAGRRLGVRRTYFTASGVASSVRTAKADIAAGRLPWMSYKLPYSWGDMAAGRGDAWAKDIARQLAALKRPVWIAFHHEPEGDGDIQAWRKMQQRLAPMVRRIAPNVGYTVILTGWHQLYGEDQYRLSKIWPRNVKIDVAGFDIYEKYGTVKDGRLVTSWTNFTDSYFRTLSRWAANHNTHFALGETGLTDAAVRARPGRMNAISDKLARLGGVAYTYFDTTLNSAANWALSTSYKVDAFHDAMVGTPVLRRP